MLEEATMSMREEIDELREVKSFFEEQLMNYVQISDET